MLEGEGITDRDLRYNGTSQWFMNVMSSSINAFPSWGPEWIRMSIPIDGSFSFLPIDYEPWVYSILASLLVGVAGIVPLIFIPYEYRNGKEVGVGSSTVLPLLLSFAVGGLLADVFLHLLPEAWTMSIQAGASPPEAFTHVGLFVLSGIFLFIIVEMLATPSQVCSTAPHKCKLNNNNNEVQHPKKEKDIIQVTGYLNLLANGVDNFAHGLAVAGSFLVSPKTGVLTTIAILIHEVPHEIGDFAILLKSGFSRWDAAKAQMYTAGVGLLGALTTLMLGTANLVGNLQVCILGFTAGGFVNIALVSVLPDLLKEERPLQSCLQLVALLFGIATMSLVSFL